MVQVNIVENHAKKVLLTLLTPLGLGGTSNLAGKSCF